MDNKEKYSLRSSPIYCIKPKEILAFNFCLKFPENMYDIPAPFSGNFGTLTYSVAAYIKSTSCNPLVAEEVLKFGGFRTLPGELPQLPIVLTHSSGYKKSFLSKEKSLTAVLSLENGNCGGFLPDEEMAFSVTIDNPKGFMVMGITAALIRYSTEEQDCCSRSLAND